MAGITGTILALVLFHERPSALQNRAAAAFLYTNGLGWTAIYGIYALDTGWLFPNQTRAGYFIWCYAVLAYLFLLSSLETPVSSWLRNLWVRTAASLLLVGLSVLIVTTEILAWELGWLRADILFDMVWASIMFYGIIVAASAWRRSLPGLVRRKNGSYALAFILHDAMIGLFLGFAWILFRFLGSYLPSGPYILALPGIAGFALQGLIVYGVLSTQLFDIDLKIRWGVSRGLLGAVFFAGAFLISELLTLVLSERMGQIMGILVTAGLLVAFSPVRRLADHIAARLLPNAQDTAEYRTQRKELVYRAQLEELMADNLVNVKERRALLRLQETLGIDGNVAARLEREVIDCLETAASKRAAGPR